MNFKQKVIILGSIICGLVVLYIMGTIITKTAFKTEYTPLFTEVNADEISSISISDPTGKAELVKSGDKWQVFTKGKKFPGDTKNIMQLINNIAAMKKNRTASSLPEKFTQFQVNPENAVHAIFSENNNAKMDIYIGKSAEDGYSQFVRVEGSDEVIQTTDRIIFSSNAGEWADKKLFHEPVTIQEIESIVVKSSMALNDSGHFEPDSKASISYTIKHNRVDNKSEFQVNGDASKVISTDSINQLIFAIYSFQAEDILINPEEYEIDVNAPLATISLNLQGGNSFTLNVVGNDKDNTSLMYITNPAEEYFYSAMSWSLQKLMPTL